MSGKLRDLLGGEGGAPRLGIVELMRRARAEKKREEKQQQQQPKAPDTTGGVAPPQQQQQQQQHQQPRPFDTTGGPVPPQQQQQQQPKAPDMSGMEPPAPQQPPQEQQSRSKLASRGRFLRKAFGGGDGGGTGGASPPPPATQPPAAAAAAATTASFPGRRIRSEAINTADTTQPSWRGASDTGSPPVGRGPLDMTWDPASGTGRVLSSGGPLPGQGNVAAQASAPLPLGQAPCSSWCFTLARGDGARCVDNSTVKNICQNRNLHLTESELERWYQQYHAGNPKHNLGRNSLAHANVLILGDFDFQMSQALVRRHSGSMNLVATTFQTRAHLHRERDGLSPGGANCSFLKQEGCLGAGYGAFPTEKTVEALGKRFGKFDYVILSWVSTAFFDLIAWTQEAKQRWTASENHSEDERVFKGREIPEALAYTAMRNLSPLLADSPAASLQVVGLQQLVNRLNTVYLPRRTGFETLPFNYLSLPGYIPLRSVGERVIEVVTYRAASLSGLPAVPAESPEAYTKEQSGKEGKKQRRGPDLPLAKAFFDDLSTLMKGSSAIIEGWGAAQAAITGAPGGVAAAVAPPLQLATPDEAAREVDEEAEEMRLRLLAKKRKAAAAQVGGGSGGGGPRKRR